MDNFTVHSSKVYHITQVEYDNAMQRYETKRSRVQELKDEIAQIQAELKRYKGM